MHNTLIRSLAALAVALTPAMALAQPFGVFPQGGSDAQVAQLHGDVLTVETRVWQVDFSQRTVKKADIISHTIDTFKPGGMISSHVAYDTADDLDSKIIFQYNDDGTKRVSTTYSKTGERTLQTLYAYTADGYLARMRFTDADAVTISTTEVSTTPTSTTTEELYNDSEKVRTTYTYDKNLNLTEVSRSDGHTTSTTSLSITYNGLPARGMRATSYSKSTLTYTHETDAQGNWTRRVTYMDGVATELAERVIRYAE